MATSASQRELPRRSVLLAALTGASTARAAQITQAEAQYQDHPRGGLSCIGCSFFRRPHACAVVAGDISPSGWCKLFDLPD